MGGWDGGGVGQLGRVGGRLPRSWHRADFAGFVISEVLGCNKPDPRMYAAGSELLGLDPGVCLFVDDDPELVLAAIRLGYHGVALLRGGGPAPASVPAIRSLEELPPIVSATP
ncbi:MAG TPA: HAD family hydrolase [Jiangellaceae bacterium]